MNLFGLLIIAALGFWVWGVIRHWDAVKIMGLPRGLVRLFGDGGGRAVCLCLSVFGVVFGLLVLNGTMTP